MKFFRFLQGALVSALLIVGMTVTVLAMEQPGIRQTGAEGRKVTLAWDRQGEAASYEIYYKYARQETYHFLKQVDTQKEHPEETVTLPKAGRKYGILVLPYDQEGHAGEVYVLEDCRTLPGKIALQSQRSYATSRSMKIYWKDVESAQGYEFLVQGLSGNFKKRYWAEKKTSIVLTGIRPGSFYRMRVRGYILINRKKVYGTSFYTYIAQQPRVKFKWSSHCTALASWPRVEGARDYLVYLTDNPARGFRKVKTVTDRQAIIPGLGKDRKYYVYVVARMGRGKSVYVSPKTKRYTFRLQTD